MATRQYRRRSPAGGSRTAKRRSGCLVWLIPVSLGTILLLANSDARHHIGRFIDGLQGAPAPRTNGSPARKPAAAASPVPAKPAAPAPGHEPPRGEPGNPALIHDLIRRDQEKLAAQAPRTPAPQAPAGTVERGRETHVHFILFDRERDRFRTVAVARPLRDGENPARDTLRLLLEGPGAQERQRGLATLIPRGTRLRGLRIEGGIAYTDLSGDFTADLRYGREGLLLQVRQIVDTLCQFPAIRGVRFLIDGKPAGVAGGDGIELDRVFRPGE